MRAIFFYFFFFNFCQASIKKGATDVGSSIFLWVISNARFLCILTGMLNVSVLQSQSRRARVKRRACVQLPRLKVSDVKNYYSFFYSVGLISVTRMTRTFLLLPLKNSFICVTSREHTQNASISHNRISPCMRFLFLVLCCVTILHQNKKKRNQFSGEAEMQHWALLTPTCRDSCQSNQCYAKTIPIEYCIPSGRWFLRALRFILESEILTNYSLCSQESLFQSRLGIYQGFK